MDKQTGLFGLMIRW